MITCTCPSSDIIPTIGTLTNCSESFGQIQKIAFSRLLKADGTKNGFALGTSTGGIQVKASWTSKITASDATKITITPYVQAPTDEGGDAITFGGGNDTLGGVEIIIGSNPVTFSGVFRGLPQHFVKAMKRLMCEAQAGNLGVYLFDENGHIEGIDNFGGIVEPIPIRALFIGDKIHGGLEAPDSNAISWAYAPNYSDNLKIFTPTDFNPLTDLGY